MGVQTADVERCCKVHKVIKTKAHNRQLINTVKMLMYCYVNLRLLKKHDKTLDEGAGLDEFLEPF